MSATSCLDGQYTLVVGLASVSGQEDRIDPALSFPTVIEFDYYGTEEYHHRVPMGISPDASVNSGGKVTIANRVVHRWKANRQDIENYPMINCRLISFSLGLQYLQEGSITVVDVGCGFSDFASQVQQKNPMAVTYYLDGNPDTVEKLKIQGYNALIYQAPARLPFDDGQIEFIHCSHMIEHLQPQELYMLLQEINRTLTVQGVLVLSTPTLWEGF